MDFPRQLLRLIKDQICLILVLIILVLAFSLTLPIITHILPHPDEYQFFDNAFNILSGNKLNSYIHVATTEYVLAIFLLLGKVFTYPGVDFFNHEFNNTVFNYGRVLGFLLYLSSFFVGSLILMKKSSRIRVRHVFWVALYFGSLGVFERFLRINSEAMAVFVVLNYFFLSFIFIEKRVGLKGFFFLDLFFVFLVSFSNLKYLFLILPVLVTNMFFTVFVNCGDERRGNKSLNLYLFFTYLVGLVVGSVVLWKFLIPRPVDVNLFWRDLTTVIQSNSLFDFNYPSQAYRSWLFYLYDLIVEYLGLTSFLAGLTVLAAVLLVARRPDFRRLLESIRTKLSFRDFSTLNIYNQTEVIILLSLLSYYLEVGRNLIHWSRWGLPLGVLTLLILSSVLEKGYFFLRGRVRLRWLILFLILLFAFSWSLRFFLVVDIKNSNYPEGNGYKQISLDVKRFLDKEGVAADNDSQEAVWFGAVGGGLRNITLDQLVDKGNQKVKYLLWPYWNIGLLHADRPVDKTTHNQKAFVNQYVQSITYRFPTHLSYYMHLTKYFAWKYLGLTWNPEIDSLVEAQYAVLKLKENVEKIDLSYRVGVGDASNCWNGFTSVCRPNPGPRVSLDLVDFSSQKVYYDHSLWFRNLFRGQYQIRLSNENNRGSELMRVYATTKFDWDEKEKVMSFDVDKQIISVEFGFTSTKLVDPNWQFAVSYRLD